MLCKAPATARTALGRGRTGLEFDMSDHTAEEWRTIAQFDGYEVSNLGRVRSIPRYVTFRPGTKPAWRAGCLLKSHPGFHGYPSVSIRRKFIPIHQLVCTAFCGDRPSPKHQVRHLNGIQTDNRAANLRWGTPSENVQDTIRHGNNSQLRKTHCPQGHPYSEPRAGKTRSCRTCATERARQYRKEGRDKWLVNRTLERAARKSA